MVSRSSWIVRRTDGSSCLLAAAAVALVANLVAVSSVALGQDAAVEEEAAPDISAEALVALVPIRLPIVGNADQSLQQTLLRVRNQLLADARSQGDPNRPVLVLKFESRSGDAGQGAGSQFERALSLARFLTSRDLAEVKTIAYVPQTIRGHAVLPAIACEELIMAPDVEIGEASADEPTVTPTVRAAYQEIAEIRNNIPQALVIAMLDPAAEVIQVESEAGGRFLLKEELSTFREENEVIKEEVLVAPGATARFTGREGRHFGFVRQVAADLPALARGLNVPLVALQEDRSLMTDWRPILLEIRGQPTSAVHQKISPSL